MAGTKSKIIQIQPPPHNDFLVVPLYTVKMIHYIDWLDWCTDHRAMPFSKLHRWWGEGGPELFLGLVPTTAIRFFAIPLPAHFKFNITLRTTLFLPLIPHFKLQIIFQSPQPFKME